MGTVLSSLGQIGYWWTYRVLDSQYFGVAQRRRRVFIVGHIGGPCPAEILFDSESLQRNPPPSGKTGTDITGSLTGSPASSSAGNVDDNRAQAGFIQLTHALTADGFDAREDGTGRGTPLVATDSPIALMTDAHHAA